MRPRELSILFGALGLVALAGIAMFAQESHAEELMPAGAEPALAPPTPPADEVQAPSASAEPVAGTIVAAPVRAADRQVDTAGWTKGIVKGDIQLAVSILDRIETIHVVVEEARSALGSDGYKPPVRLVVPVERGRGTPTFTVTDIPFSEYPYVVSVLSPKLNGSRRTITIDAENPYVNDVVLQITPGAPLSVLVRDQDSVPFPGLDVRVLPVGEPNGRPSHQGTSDNFGSLVFDSVLAGDYQVFVNQSGQALLEPQTISVQPGATAARAKVIGQSLALTIPRGVPVRLMVHDRAGYGIGDAQVMATMTDRVRLTTRETTTNSGGAAELPHLQPGVWQIRVTKDKYELWDRQVTLRANQDPLQLDVGMVPSR